MWFKVLPIQIPGSYLIWGIQWFKIFGITEYRFKVFQQREEGGLGVQIYSITNSHNNEVDEKEKNVKDHKNKMPTQ